MESTRINRSFAIPGMALLLALLFALAAAGTARAEATPFKIEFDKSEIQMSLIGGLPLDSISSNATMEGTIDDSGKVNVPKGKFQMPTLGIDEPVAVRGFMGIESDATGTFDRSTGQLELDAKAGLWVSVNVKQLLDAASGLGLDLSDQLGGISQYLGLLGNLTCGFSPMDVVFTTESTSLATGKRFEGGITGPGAISAEWSKLGPFAGRSTLNSIVCPMIPQMLPGLLSGIGGGTDIGGIDLGGLIGGIDLSNLDDLDLGPSGITLTRTIDEGGPIKPGPNPKPGPGLQAKPAKLKLKVTPRKRRARAGTKIRYRAVVRNVGGSRATKVKVCVKVPKRAAKVKRCRNLGALAPKASKKRVFNLRLRGKARKRVYKISFRTTSSAKTKPRSSSRLRIR